jgi:hypothetical protein
MLTGAYFLDPGLLFLMYYKNISGALSFSCFSSMVKVRIWFQYDIRLNYHIDTSFVTWVPGTVIPSAVEKIAGYCPCGRETVR